MKDRPPYKIGTTARLEHLLSRRTFFEHIGKSGVGLAVLNAFGAGTNAALQGLFGRNLVPIVWAAEEDLLAEKPGMLVHTNQPINGEFPPHLLDDNITPVTRHFVRNNGSVPARAQQRDLQGWQLVVDGEVDTPLALSLEDLKQLPSVSLQAVIECGGNGRALFDPAVRGNPWERGGYWLQ